MVAISPRSTMGEAAESDDNVPVRCMIACRLDSTSTISTLSIPADFLDAVDSCPTMPGRMASIPRIMNNSERFKVPTNQSDKAPKRPTGRRLTITRPTANSKSRAAAPPRIPSRQDTADTKTFFNTDTTDDRPGLNRMPVAGGKLGLSNSLRGN